MCELARPRTRGDGEHITTVLGPRSALSTCGVRVGTLFYERCDRLFTQPLRAAMTPRLYVDIMALSVCTLKQKIHDLQWRMRIPDIAHNSRFADRRKGGPYHRKRGVSGRPRGGVVPGYDRLVDAAAAAAGPGDFWPGTSNDIPSSADIRDMRSHADSSAVRRRGRCGAAPIFNAKKSTRMISDLDLSRARALSHAARVVRHTYSVAIRHSFVI